MKIFNFNHFNVNYWNTWRKYFQEIHYKTNSLYDYWYYYNPDYDILNSVQKENPLEDGILKKLGLLKENVTIIGSEQTYRVFYPYKLKFHQGMINLGSDAFLQWNPSSDLDLSTATIFKSGYCVINNIQPIGPDLDTNLEKQKKINYFIYPLGNGSFYIFRPLSEKNLNVFWYPNEIGNTANSITINLSNYYLRYINNSKENTYWSKDPNNIQKAVNISSNNISDFVGNKWSGPVIFSEETNSYLSNLQYYFILEKQVDENAYQFEDFITDSQEEINSSVDLKNTQYESIYRITTTDSWSFGNNASEAIKIVII